MDLWIIIIALAFFVHENIIEYDVRRRDEKWWTDNERGALKLPSFSKLCTIKEERGNTWKSPKKRDAFLLLLLSRYRFSLKVIIANEESEDRDDFVEEAARHFRLGRSIERPIIRTSIIRTCRSLQKRWSLPDHYIRLFQSCQNSRASLTLRDMKRDASAMSKWKSWRCADTTIKDHRPCVAIVRELPIRWTCLLPPNTPV